MYKRLTVEDMIGKTFENIEIKKDESEIYFYTNDGYMYKMYHKQECSEDVYIEDICGNLANLRYTPILIAEEVINVSDSKTESLTWTFYKFVTAKGYVTMRWYGESNGFYSETVDLELYKFIK